MVKPVFGYWGVRGLGQPIRMLLAYLEVDYEEKRYTQPEQWFGEKFTLGLDFPNLPYWKDSDFKLTESKAILKCIARERGSGLMPTNNEMQRKADMLENYINDMWFQLIRTCMQWTDEARAGFDKDMPVKFQQLEKFLGKNKFILGDKISFLDFLICEMLYHFTTYDPEFLKPYPSLAAYKANFEAIPTIAAYIKSPQYIKGPCISPMAKRKI